MKTKFLESAPGIKSSKRLFTLWFVVMATIGFIMSFLLPILNVTVSPAMVDLSKTAMWCGVTLGAGGTAAEHLDKVFRKN